MSNQPKEQSCKKCVEVSAQLEKLENEISNLKAGHCRHGFEPGQHMQGIVGCEKCVGK